MYVSFCGKKTLLESDLYDICLQYSLNNIYINSVKTLYIAKITVNCIHTIFIYFHIYIPILLLRFYSFTQHIYQITTKMGLCECTFIKQLLEQ